MTKKRTAVLAFGLAATAAFGQANAAAARARKEQAGPLPAAAAVKMLRGEIKRDRGDMAVKTRDARAERKQLRVQEKVALAQVAKSTATRAEKKRARAAVRAKYAQLRKDARAKGAYERRNLSEDIASKRGQIKKLRRS